VAYCQTHPPPSFSTNDLGEPSMDFTSPSTFIARTVPHLCAVSPASRRGTRAQRPGSPLLKIRSRRNSLRPYSRTWTSQNTAQALRPRGAATSTCCRSTAALVVSHHLDGSGSRPARGMLHPSRTGFTPLPVRSPLPYVPYGAARSTHSTEPLSPADPARNRLAARSRAHPPRDGLDSWHPLATQPPKRSADEGRWTLHRSVTRRSGPASA
jgi:hypothetical protein